MTLQYLPPDRLGLAPDELPRSAWPRPRAHLPPFHEGFTDYLRAVAPGVYVGWVPAGACEGGPACPGQGRRGPPLDQWECSETLWRRLLGGC